jgi:F-type H+-transporting ATPase subunit epsilon
MRCELRSPTRAYYTGEATLVVARSHRGEFAVMQHHAPLLAELRPGVVRIQTGEEEKAFACFGGSLAVKEDIVSIFVLDAVAVEEIDLDAARRALEDPGLDEIGRQRASERLEMLSRAKEEHG